MYNYDLFQLASQFLSIISFIDTRSALVVRTAVDLGEAANKGLSTEELPILILWSSTRAEEFLFRRLKLGLRQWGEARAFFAIS